MNSGIDDHSKNEKEVIRPTKKEIVAKFRELESRFTNYEDDVLDLVEHFFGFSDSGLTLDDKVTKLSDGLRVAEDRASRHDNEIASYRGEIEDLLARVEELEKKTGGDSQ